MDKYKPLDVEREILEFWQKKKIYEKQKAKGKKGKKFYFLQGPPYTSGKFHIGHLWNYSLKDPVLRYRRMRGFDVWDRGGWDMHGLPTSRKVMAKLGLKSKEDIEKFGVDKFVKECEKFSIEKMKEMEKDLIRWGVWLDHKNAYMPIKPEFIEGVWWLIKKAWERGFLYEGEKVMHWCPETETVAAKHELEYKEVVDDSIYLKFKVKAEDNTYLIIWTTTPWTIPFNLAVMVHPNFVYVKAKVNNEIWIVAKELCEKFFELVKEDYEIVEEIKGKQLEGLKYEHFLESDVPALKEMNKYKNAFSVVLSDKYVDLEAGTGLVHCAPGCGPEDQEVGKEYGLPPFNLLDTRGYFPKEMGVFEGWRARYDDKKFIDFFKKKGVLIAKTKIKHDYPFHERSKAPVIFRVTKQWFFAIEKVKHILKEWNKQVNWVPRWAGESTFENWIENLKDIGISRQRYWGTPLPIWRCDSCNQILVIGSIDELKKYAKVPKNLHKPWIDDVEFKCKNCKKGKMKRIPDIGDVWIDAGCTSWIDLYYPKTDKYFKKYWPADFIAEGKEQIRGWFNLLFDTAAISVGELPFLNCYMHGWINDAQGRKMSKSLGNVIDPYEVIDKYGVDAVRYYLMGGAQPGVDLNYNFKDLNVKFRNLGILWNIGNFLIDFVETNNIKLPKNPSVDLEERFILSKTNRTIKEVTKAFDNYFLNEIPNKIEELYLELSRTYIKFVRDKSALGTKEQKEAIAYTIFESLMAILKMLAPVTPFITEKIYQKLKKTFKLKEESIHLFDWPGFDENLIDDKIENAFGLADEIITAVLSIRDRKKIGVRWPLSQLLVVVNQENAEFVNLTKDIILRQCNVKELKILSKKPEWVRLQIRVNHNMLAKRFKEKEPIIVGKLIQLSPESVKQKLDKGESVIVEVDDEKYELSSDEVYIEEVLPENWAASGFQDGSVYLNIEINEDLFSEGLSREIIRRIQDLRKEAGLKKTDKAKAVVLLEKGYVPKVKRFKKDIEARTGTLIEIHEIKELKEKFVVKANIRGVEVIVGLKPL